MASYDLNVMTLDEAVALKGYISYKSKDDLDGVLVNKEFTKKLYGHNRDVVETNIMINNLNLMNYADIIFENEGVTEEMLIVSIDLGLNFVIDNQFAINLDKTWPLPRLKDVNVTFNNVLGTGLTSSHIETIERLIVSLIRSGKIEIAFTFELI